jgi:MFS family permease
VSLAASSADGQRSTPPRGDSARPSRLGVLKNRPFAYYLVAQVISGSGTLAQTTAIAWIVVSRGHGNGVLLGAVSGGGFVPSLLLSVWGGRVVDSHDSQKLLVITSSIYGLIAAAFGFVFLATNASLWWLVALSLSMGVIGVVDNPARQRFIGRIAGDSELQSALGVYQTGFGIARIAGPLLAGLVLALVAPGWVFLGNALTFALPIAAVTIIGRRHLAPQKPGRAKPRAGAIAAAWRSPIMRACLLTSFAAGTFGMQYPVTNPLIVHDFRLGPIALGALGAALAVGAIGGGLLVPRLPYRGPAYGLACVSAMGVFMAATGVATYEPVLMLLCTLIGVTIVVTTTTVGTTVQRIAPEDYRGRMIALNTLAFTGAFPVGSLLVGAINDSFGIATATAATGLICTAITISVAVYWLPRRKDEHARLVVPTASC